MKNHLLKQKVLLLFCEVFLNMDFPNENRFNYLEMNFNPPNFLILPYE